MKNLPVINTFLIILLSAFVVYIFFDTRRFSKPVLKDFSAENEAVEFTDIHKPDEYRVEVYQVGGQGVREFQITAYYSEEHGYLHPVDEYASAIMNGGGDYVWLSCREGYSLSDCKGGINPKIDEDDASRCSSTLTDVPKTLFSFLCTKQ